jgi:hypothetical protein
VPVQPHVPRETQPCAAGIAGQRGRAHPRAVRTARTPRARGLRAQAAGFAPLSRASPISIERPCSPRSRSRSAFLWRHRR